MCPPAHSNIRPVPDQELVTMAEYVCNMTITSEEAYSTARYVLLDSLGCAFLALSFPECTRLLGPVVPGTVVPGGARVPGTAFELDPVQAAFDTGVLIRWLDYNDTWLAAEWGHPSDNLGGLLPVADFVSRRRDARGEPPVTMHDLLTALIKAYEIQGVLSLENAFNRVGLDHVVLVKVATTALATKMLGGERDAIVAALSQAWLDGQCLRTYRHAPNTGTRKSWAAGDATSRGVRLAMLTIAGESGYVSPLTARQWGFYDVCFRGQSFRMPRQFGSYVMENILFKVSFPAEFHAQTAVECALQLHGKVRERLDQIDRIEIRTQESALRIISKDGPLHNAADRDHCLQYMVAVGLLYGVITADHYSDGVAADQRIDQLRQRMVVQEEPSFSRDYLDPERRSIANSLQIFFRDGTATDKVVVEYPLGHRRRRREALPLLLAKCRDNMAGRLSEQRIDEFIELCLDPARLFAMPVHLFMELLLTRSCAGSNP